MNATGTLRVGPVALRLPLRNTNPSAELFQNPMIRVLISGCCCKHFGRQLTAMIVRHVDVAHGFVDSLVWRGSAVSAVSRSRRARAARGVKANGIIYMDEDSTALSEFASSRFSKIASTPTKRAWAS